MGLRDLILRVGEIIEYLVFLLFGLALLGLFWGLTKYIFQAANEKAKDDGRSMMVWSVVALTVMASIWGIIAWLQSDLQLPQADVAPLR